jgi:HK97 family phage prohead protease
MKYHERLIRMSAKLLIRPRWADDADTSDMLSDMLNAKQLSLELRSDTPRLKALDDEGRLHVTSLASTPDIDLQNEIVEVGAFASSLQSFALNPQMLAYHDMAQPVGLWPEQKITAAGLVLSGFISSARPDIQRLVLDGVLAHASVGFYVRNRDWDDDLDVLRITDLELIEASLVPIPANPYTFVEAAKAWRDGEVVRLRAAPETPAERPDPEPPPAATEKDDDADLGPALDAIEAGAARIGSALASAAAAVSE